VLDIEARASLLGLAVGALRYPLDAPPPWRLERLAPPAPAAPHGTLVVNLGSLWAAPLCAHLLARGGADVIDIESPDRPDGSRLGTPDFYRLLHEGHRRSVIDLHTSTGLAELHRLLHDADVIITSSRSRALTQLGVTPDNIAAGHDQTWIGINGHDHDQNRIAFGDDAAVAGGLLAWDDTGPVFAGDAIADPLTGLLAALAATACQRAGGTWHVHLALRDVAAYSVTAAAGRQCCR
jgi:crotonobetainyl-CoA:carnitine CoA-transferase CaiB-like acyl-CoA transferase